MAYILNWPGLIGATVIFLLMWSLCRIGCAIGRGLRRISRRVMQFIACTLLGLLSLAGLAINLGIGAMIVLEGAPHNLPQFSLLLAEGLCGGWGLMRLGAVLRASVDGLSDVFRGHTAVPTLAPS